MSDKIEVSTTVKRKMNKLINIRLKRDPDLTYWEVDFPATMEYDSEGKLLRYMTTDGQTITAPTYRKCFYYSGIMPSDEEKEWIYRMIQDLLPDRFKNEGNS